MSKEWYPIINYDNCIACGLCIEKCNHGVYELNTTTPKVIQPDNCKHGCHGCQSKCPVDAITYAGNDNLFVIKNSGCSCN